MNYEYTDTIQVAIAVDREASANPVGVAVDPDVADVMGAFEEDALALDDLDEVDDGHE
jgi:hypothetical protein